MPYSIDVNLQIKKKKQTEMWITNWGTMSYIKYHFLLCCWAQNHAIHIKKS